MTASSSVTWSGRYCSFTPLEFVIGNYGFLTGAASLVGIDGVVVEVQVKLDTGEKGVAVEELLQGLEEELGLVDAGFEVDMAVHVPFDGASILGLHGGFENGGEGVGLEYGLPGGYLAAQCQRVLMQDGDKWIISSGC